MNTVDLGYGQQYEGDDFMAAVEALFVNAYNNFTTEAQARRDLRYGMIRVERAFATTFDEDMVRAFEQEIESLLLTKQLEASLEANGVKRDPRYDLPAEDTDGGYGADDIYASPPVGSGRGPTGKLRNFAAMKDQKLVDIIAALRVEGDDPEAITVAEAEWMSRR
jgi:hypothetical protein